MDRREEIKQVILRMDPEKYEKAIRLLEALIADKPCPISQGEGFRQDP